MKVGCNPSRRLVPFTLAGEQGPATGASSFVCRGFSLLELLVVVAILVILTVLYWGPLTSQRGRQSGLECRQNLEKLYISIQIFGNEHAGKLPVVSGATNAAQALALLVPKYASDTSLFICPAQKRPVRPAAESFASARIGYAYYMGRRLANSDQALVTDAQVDTLAKAAGQLVFSATGEPPGNNHKDRGGNILYCDGHVMHSPVNAAGPLDTGPGVVLLNP